MRRLFPRTRLGLTTDERPVTRAPRMTCRPMAPFNAYPLIIATEKLRMSDAPKKAQNELTFALILRFVFEGVIEGGLYALSRSLGAGLG